MLLHTVSYRSNLMWSVTNISIYWTYLLIPCFAFCNMAPFSFYFHFLLWIMVCKCPVSITNTKQIFELTWCLPTRLRHNFLIQVVPRRGWQNHTKTEIKQNTERIEKHKSENTGNNKYVNKCLRVMIVLWFHCNFKERMLKLYNSK